MDATRENDLKLALKLRMLDIALAEMKENQSCVGYDMHYVDRMHPSMKAVWLLRDYGTDIGTYADLLNPDRGLHLIYEGGRNRKAYIIEELELIEIPIGDLMQEVLKRY